MRLFLIFFLLSFMLTNCPTDENTDIVEMTATVSPSEAGDVNPKQGSYIAGREITIVTEAVDDRWEFTGWEGDTTASDDSLTLTIVKDMDLIATYEIPSDTETMLSTSTEPEEAGIIEPDAGQFEYGSSLQIQATPAEGWEFVEWSGDTSATANPLDITMDRDYELTANFTKHSRAFTNQITVTDGDNSKEVVLGMHEEATSGFDSGIDEELPPRPMEDAFYRRFNIPDYGLKDDFRPISDEETIWELEVSPEDERTIFLEWDFSNSDHVGTLTLTNDLEDPSVEVDMKSETSFEASDEPVQIFYIISRNQN